VKKEVSGGTVAAIIGGVIAVVGLFYLVQWMSGGGQSASDRDIEKMQVEQAKSEYGRYQNPGTSSGGGPPVSGEGDAQAAAPGGVPAGR